MSNTLIQTPESGHADARIKGTNIRVLDVIRKIHSTLPHLSLDAVVDSCQYYMQNESKFLDSKGKEKTPWSREYSDWLERASSRQSSLGALFFP